MMKKTFGNWFIVKKICVLQNAKKGTDNKVKFINDNIVEEVNN
jgi:hypothetical protein